MFKDRNLFSLFKANNRMLAPTKKMRVTSYLFALGFIALSVGSVMWITNFFHSLQEYKEYCEMVKDQGSGLPAPYHLWESGRYFNVTLIALFFLWIPFIDQSLRKTLYPFLRRKLTYREAKSFSSSVSRSLYEDLYRLILGYFNRVNRKVRAKIPLWFMKLETFEHVHLLTKVFKWIVLPSSVLYGCAMFIFFGQNALGSILVANLLFFYSNFLPDLPAIFRRKLYRDERDTFHEDLPRYKTYALLLFAPFFIALLFCGKKTKWRTTETFHNFRSLIVYGAFLFTLDFLVLAVFHVSLGGIIGALFVPLFGLLGYLTHLKVDLIF
jgi:ABC-type multidrug transport system fused ATPase/permease subunit